MTPELAHRDSLGKQIHDNAWGKPWPNQRAGTIYKTDIVPPGQVYDNTDHLYGGVAASLEIPDEYCYICFLGMQGLARVLGSTTDFEDILVLRNEYIWLRRMLMEGPLRDNRAIVVTGHPGIGKTMFLLYFLLYRLEHRLPTAVQMGSRYYFIFDAAGAKAYSTSSCDLPRLMPCWALVDSNAYVIQPSEVLLDAAHIIQTCPPNPERWKSWLEQKKGCHVISAFPTPAEIAAILKELNITPSRGLPLLCKWGPSIRTIIRILAANDPVGMERNFQIEAEAAAARVCADPTILFTISGKEQMPASTAAKLIHLRPVRRVTTEIDVGLEDLDQGVPHIPTKHLAKIFESYGTLLSNDKSLQLSRDFCSPFLTGPAGDWSFQAMAHRRLCSGGPALHIFRGRTTKEMRPSTVLIPGTIGGLKAATSYSFYWTPSVDNFPGINGVLADGDDVFVMQMTIATDHVSPLNKLQSILEHVHPTLRSRTWHVVVLTNERELAEQHAAKFSRDSDEVAFSAEVWGCVLNL